VAHPSRAALRASFDARVAAAAREFGPDFEWSTILEEFQDKGLGRATVFRWMAAAKKSAVAGGGGEGKRPRGRPRRAAAEPVVVAGIARKLPPIPTVRDMTASGLLPVMTLLQDCIRHAQDLITHARGTDGGVRNARLLMQASEHLRRAVETAAKLNETVAIQQEMQAFHTACLSEIAIEAPAVQERILNRLHRACDATLTDG
jgi:hypothetical protein